MAVDAAPRTRVPAVPALFGVAVLAQVAYPLASGTARDDLTVATVVLVAAAVLLHAYRSRGVSTAVVLAVVTIGGGFVVEVVGVHASVPFGSYSYGDSLGPTLFGVPLVIGPAWTMLAWPAALAARRLARTFAARVLLGGWALAGWDLFLDPQMVAAGHWTWHSPDPHLPGVPSVPLTDYAGWLVVALLVSVVLQRSLQHAPAGDDRWPLAFYVWTWASSTLALAAFLGLPAAAVWGGIGMGSVAVPLTRQVWR